MVFLVRDEATASRSPVPLSGHLRVGLVQAHSTLGTETRDPRDDNLGRALSAVRELSRQSVQLVIFGEMYLNGYQTNEWLHKWATTVNPADRHVAALIECAREHDVFIIMGAATFGHFMPGDVYNSALFVGPEGLIGVYRKCHVAAFTYSQGVADERCFYSPGNELPVYETSLGRIGVHICYDFTFPEVPRVQTLRGAELLVNVAGSGAGFEELWDHMLVTRSIENMSWYLMCSVVGQQRDVTLFGGSRVLDPAGRVIARAKDNQEDVVVADIDLELSRKLRATSHAFNTRRPELYRAIAEPVPYP